MPDQRFRLKVDCECMGCRIAQLVNDEYPGGIDGNNAAGLLSYFGAMTAAMVHILGSDGVMISRCPDELFAKLVEEAEHVH